ncbi:MAG: glycoside hydrolase family 43 protein, partial [Coprobacter sp.]
YDLFIKQLPDKKQALTLRYRLGELSHIEKEIVLPKGDIQLRVKGNRDFYSFEYATNNKTFHELGRMNTRYLSTETAGGFTGIMLGLYAVSINLSSKGYAEFEYFDYLGE